MLIRLDPEQVDPIVWEETQEIPSEYLDSGLQMEVGPVLCRGSLKYVSPGFLLEADLTYDRRMICTRCLEPIAQDQETHLELLVLTGEEESSEEVELEEDDLHIVRVMGESLDTEPLVFDQVQLQVPMKALCREDCLGLCASCGSNRNETPNCCSETGYDAAWSGLRALKERLQEDDS